MNDTIMPFASAAVRYTVHWGLDHATRIASSADLDRLLAFLTTARGRDGARR